jgi:hypothetical protein
MLTEFLRENRLELIERCHAKRALRSTTESTAARLEHGIPLFLDQIIQTLDLEKTSGPMRGHRVSGPPGGEKPVSSEIGDTATRHGRELLQHGFTIDQVVHDYGDLCQAITDLAFEQKVAIETDQFRTLNRCLDNGIADAVTEFAYQRDLMVAEEATDALNVRLGLLAHEVRNGLNTATLALNALRTGQVGLSGATGAVLDRSLIRVRHLIDTSLAEVRVTAGLPVNMELISLPEFIADVGRSAALEAQAFDCTLVVSTVDVGLAIDGDRELLFSAVNNLLQNAFKFTRHSTDVLLNAYPFADRVIIAVQDHCGGLPNSDLDFLSTPFIQTGRNRSGLGLGLSVCRRSVEANDGVLRVRDMPGEGCIFTIDLPRRSLPSTFIPPQATY